MFPPNQCVQTLHQLISPVSTSRMKKQKTKRWYRHWLRDRTSLEGTLTEHSAEGENMQQFKKLLNTHTHIARHSRDMSLNFPRWLFLFFPSRHVRSHITLRLSSVWSVTINNLWMLNIKWSSQRYQRDAAGSPAVHYVTHPQAGIDISVLNEHSGTKMDP